MRFTFWNKKLSSSPTTIVSGTLQMLSKYTKWLNKPFSPPIESNSPSLVINLNDFSQMIRLQILKVFLTAKYPQFLHCSSDGMVVRSGPSRQDQSSLKIQQSELTKSWPVIIGQENVHSPLLSCSRYFISNNTVYDCTTDLFVWQYPLNISFEWCQSCRVMDLFLLKPLTRMTGKLTVK